MLTGLFVTEKMGRLGDLGVMFGNAPTYRFIGGIESEAANDHHVDHKAVDRPESSLLLALEQAGGERAKNAPHLFNGDR